MQDTQVHNAIVITHFGHEVLIQPEQQPRLRAVPRSAIDPLVTGDRVHWHSNSTGPATITERQPRHNELARLVKGQRKVFAANIDLTLIVIAIKPTFKTGLIDRYLCASEIAGVKPALILNKTDLLDEDKRSDVINSLHVYEKIGYEVIFTSTKTGENLSEFDSLLDNKTAILVGQSGVGKSSVIRALCPASTPAIGDVSTATNKGKHTTTHSEIYSVDEHAYIIDSPGVREFGLEPVEYHELADSFIEFRPFIGTCKFRNCRHTGEKGCAIEQAVSDGKVAKKRLDSYRSILEEM